MSYAIFRSESINTLKDLGEIGAICTKGTSLRPKTGNKAPRVCETSSGMLNAIGLENKGLEYFAEFDLPFLKKFDII